MQTLKTKVRVRSQGIRASTVGTLEPLPTAVVMTQLNHEAVVMAGCFR